MQYHILKWSCFGSSAHMQSRNPLHLPASGSTGECQCPLPPQGYSCWLAPLHSHALPPHTFPSLLWGSPPLATMAASTASSFPFQHSATMTHSLLLVSLSGPQAHQVPLSCISRASRAKFDEGLQYNTHRVYQCKQQTF